MNSGSPENSSGLSDGYTIVELLISVQIALWLVGLIYVVFLFALQAHEKWQQKLECETLYAVISLRVIRELDDVREILSAGKYGLTALKTSGDTLKISSDCFTGLENLNRGNNLQICEFHYLSTQMQGWKQFPLNPEKSIILTDRIMGISLTLQYKCGKRSYEIWSTVVFRKLKKDILKDEIREFSSGFPSN